MANRTYHSRGELIDGYACGDHPLYITWADMLSRCYNKQCPSYEDYGGRGILVDPRWFHFVNFVEDMVGRPYPEASIDRVDNNKGYCLNNCLWATRSEQVINRRRFKNNKSGKTGVRQIKDRFTAVADFDNERFQLGRFATFDESKAAREAFIGLFWIDRMAALALIPEETLWCTSTTKVRGVVPHADGGYIVRVTINKQRIYLGYYKTLDEAIDAKNRATEV